MTTFDGPEGVVDIIAHRRSVRSYLPDPVDEATVRRLLRAAVRAPTAMHQEACGFLVIQNTDLLQYVSTVARECFVEELRHSSPRGQDHDLEIFARPDFNIFYDASTLIVICGRTEGHFVDADCWLAAENLMLAACGMNLGSCVIGSAVAGLNDRRLRAELGIPDWYRVVAPVIVGVPRLMEAVSPRKEPAIIGWKK